MGKEFERLVKWYREQCNGDWEHQNGIHLETLDNPGWSLDVNLAETSLAGRTVPLTKVERTEDDWVFYEVKGDVFSGNCGPENLIEMVGLFLTFAGASKV